MKLSRELSIISISQSRLQNMHRRAGEKGDLYKTAYNFNKQHDFCPYNGSSSQPLDPTPHYPTSS